MQPILKPHVRTAIWFGSVGLMVVCAALNRWSFSGDEGTPQASLFFGITTLFLGALAMSAAVSDRVRSAVVLPTVDSKTVQRRFLLTAGIALVIGAIVCVAAVRQFE